MRASVHQMFMCYITDSHQPEGGVLCKSHPMLTLTPWDSQFLYYAHGTISCYKIAPRPQYSRISNLPCCITAVNQVERTFKPCPETSASRGQTGYLITELLLANTTFSKKLKSITGLTLNPSSPKCKELQKFGAKIVEHKPGRVREMAQTLKQTGADAIYIIPPANPSKMGIRKELVEASKQANTPNVCLISSAGCDLANEKKQPRLREFIEIEQMAMSTKGDSETETGHSPVVIR
jgi:hypothetical protein